MASSLPFMDMISDCKISGIFCTVNKLYSILLFTVTLIILGSAYSVAQETYPSPQGSDYYYYNFFDSNTSLSPAGKWTKLITTGTTPIETTQSLDWQSTASTSNLASASGRCLSSNSLSATNGYTMMLVPSGTSLTSTSVSSYGWAWSFLYKMSSTGGTSADNGDAVTAGENSWKYWLYATTPSAINGTATNPSQGCFITHDGNQLKLRYVNSTGSTSNVDCGTYTISSDKTYAIKVQYINSQWQLYVDEYDATNYPDARTLRGNGNGTPGGNYLGSVLQVASKNTDKFQFDEVHMYSRKITIVGANESSNGVSTSVIPDDYNVPVYGLKMSTRGNFSANQLKFPKVTGDLTNVFSTMYFYQSTNSVFGDPDDVKLFNFTSLSNAEVQNYNSPAFTATFGSNGNSNGTQAIASYYYISGDIKTGANTSFQLKLSVINNATFADYSYTPVAADVTPSFITTIGRVLDWEGNHGNVKTAWEEDKNWIPQFVPTAADRVRIGYMYFNGNQPTLASTTTVNSMILGTTTASTLTINSGYTLNVTRTLTQNNSATTSISNTITGSGTLSTGYAVIGSASTMPSLATTTTLTSSVANLNVSNTVRLISTNTGILSNNASFVLASGTATIPSFITTNATGSTSSILMNSGSQNGTLSLTGTTPFSLSLSGTNTLNLNGTGSTVNYSGTGGQTIYATSYNNLTLSGSGSKTLGTGTITIGGNLTASGGTMAGGTSTTIFTGTASQIAGDNAKNFNHLTINSGASVSHTAASMQINGDFSNSGTFTQNSGLTTAFGGVTQALSGTVGNSTTFGSVTVQGTSTLSAGSQNFTVNGTFNASSPAGVFNGGTGTVTFSGATAMGDNAGTYNFNNIIISTGTLSNANNKSFTVGGNWTNNSIYAKGEETITFNSSAAQTIGGSGTETPFYNVNFQGGGTKTFSGTGSSISNSAVISTGNVVNANAKLTLISTATRNANLFGPTDGSSAYITGDVKVQSYLTGGTGTRRYKFVSSPINDAVTNGLSKKTYAQIQNSIYVTGASGTGFDSGTTTNTIQTYDETLSPAVYSYKGITNITDVVTPGVGFVVFFRGNRSSGSLTNSSPENVTLAYQGTVNQGPVTVSNLKFTDYSSYVYPNSTFIKSDGLNLVGNPYPCTIDFNLIDTLDRKNINKTVYVGKPGSSGFSGIVKGATFNSGTSYIQPGQSFFVQATVNNSSITFRESCKYTGTLQPMRLLSTPQSAGNRQSTSSAANQLPKLLRINLQDALNIDETLIEFKEKNKTVFNLSEDASYMGGSTVSLNSVATSGDQLLYNGMPAIRELNDIKLQINASVSGNVKLNFTDLSAIGNYQMFLKDSYLNQVVDVKANPTYAFVIDKKIPATFGATRFTLQFKEPIPVKISEFNALKVQSKSEISWTTENEFNTERFEVERSTDKIIFTAIANISKQASAKGASNYAYTDNSPESGLNYYRLKQVDLEGKLTYTDTLSVLHGRMVVAVAETQLKLSIYPNPTVDKLVVNLPDGSDQDGVTMSVYDMQGNKVKSTRYEHKKELEQNVSDLTANIYLLEIRDSKTNQLIGTSKFLKQ